MKIIRLLVPLLTGCSVYDSGLLDPITQPLQPTPTRECTATESPLFDDCVDKAPDRWFYCQGAQSPIFDDCIYAEQDGWGQGVPVAGTRHFPAGTGGGGVGGIGGGGTGGSVAICKSLKEKVVQAASDIADAECQNITQGRKVALCGDKYRLDLLENGTGLLRTVEGTQTEPYGIVSCLEECEPVCSFTPDGAPAPKPPQAGSEAFVDPWQ